MRELHVIGLSADGASVLLATTPGASKAGYRVRVAGTLTAAVRGDLPRPGAPAEPPADLTPKVIQARLRAGETPQQIADSAGVAVSRVERFEGPVASERARVIEQTRAAHVVRGRKGRSAAPLGECVDASLAAVPGFDEETVDWSARRRDDGRWQVDLAFAARGRTRTARWLLDPSDRTVVAADPASAALAHVATAPARAGGTTKGRSRGSTSPRAASGAPKSSAKKGAPTAATAKKAPTKQAKAPAKRAPATKAPAKRAPAAKAPAKRAPVVKVPAKRAPGTQVLPPVVKRATTPAPVVTKAGRTATAASARRLRAVPDAPARARAGSSGPAPGKADGTRVASGERGTAVTPPAVPARGAAARRASVPAWADVLLGTSPTPPQDRG